MKNTSKINEKLKQVWKSEPIHQEPKKEEQQKKEEEPKVILPPSHILGYRFKEKEKVANTEVKKIISYQKAKDILGYGKSNSVAVLVSKGKIIGGNGFVEEESVIKYINERLPVGIAGITARRELRYKNKKDTQIDYEQACEILGINKNKLYDLIWRKQIDGKDGLCEIDSVMEFKKILEKGIKKGRKLKIKNPIDEAIDSFFEGVKPLVLGDPIECLPPEKIVVPTLEDIEKALNENVVGDSYKHLKIVTVEWSKANHTKEQQKAICQFMINKYTMRQKNQDKDDIKKARFYLDWLEETI